MPRPAPHILLVEDDPAVGDATRMLLAAAGCRVSMAVDGGEGLRIATEEAVDAVVTDYNLAGELTGTQMVAQLHARRGTPVKAIVLTGDVAAARQELMRGDAVRLMAKPIRAEEFLAVLHELLAS